MYDQGGTPLGAVGTKSFGDRLQLLHRRATGTERLVYLKDPIGVQGRELGSPPEVLRQLRIALSLGYIRLAI